MIIVPKLFDEKQGKMLFDSQYGCFLAYAHDMENTAFHKSYDVEIDISATLSFEDISISERNDFCIEKQGSKTHFSVLVVSYDDDGVLCANLGGSVFLMDTAEDNRFKSLVEKFIEFTVENVDVFSTGLG